MNYALTDFVDYLETKNITTNQCYSELEMVVDVIKVIHSEPFEPQIILCIVPSKNIREVIMHDLFEATRRNNVSMRKSTSTIKVLDTSVQFIVSGNDLLEKLKGISVDRVLYIGGPIK